MSTSNRSSLTLAVRKLAITDGSFYPILLNSYIQLVDIAIYKLRNLISIYQWRNFYNAIMIIRWWSVKHENYEYIGRDHVFIPYGSWIYLHYLKQTVIFGVYVMHICFLVAQFQFLQRCRSPLSAWVPTDCTFVMLSRVLLLFRQLF